MRVQVKLIGVLAGLAEKKDLSIELEGDTDVNDLVKRLAETFKDKFSRRLIDPELGDPRVNSIILVNGRDTGVLDGIQTKLNDGDLVTILSVSHGG
jgi:molybdopterin converting factor small subunit